MYTISSQSLLWFSIIYLFCFASTSLAASQATSLLNSATQLKDGAYFIQNVATGQRLTGNRNNLYPAYGQGTAVTVVAHTSTGKHTVLGLGNSGQRKCISAAWSNGAGNDATGSMYSCVLGILAAGNAKSTLRPDKQAFILVPGGSQFKRGVATNQADDGLEEQSIFADEEELADGRMVKRSGKGSQSYGPFYMITTDHLADQAPRALVNQAVVSLGQRVMKLVQWQKGNKNQLWEFIPA